MFYLTEADIILIHNRLVETTGGLQGIRNDGAIKSVVGQPRQRVFGRVLYPSIFLKAAVYARNIVLHHPFLDGNKRTGITAASVFLEENGYEMRALEGELFDLAISIAEEKIEPEEIALWLEEHSVQR